MVWFQIFSVDTPLFQLISTPKKEISTRIQGWKQDTESWVFQHMWWFILEGFFCVITFFGNNDRSWNCGIFNASDLVANARAWIYWISPQFAAQVECDGCCTVLQCVAACCSVLQRAWVYWISPQVAAQVECSGYCSVLQRVAACCSVWRFGAGRSAGCCRVL